MSESIGITSSKTKEVFTIDDLVKLKELISKISNNQYILIDPSGHLYKGGAKRIIGILVGNLFGEEPL